MILAAIYDFLTSYATVNDAVSGRIFPTAADQGAQRPFIEFRVITSEGHTHLEGNSKVYSSLVTIDVTSDRSLTSDTIAMDCLESGLVGYRGQLGDPPVNIHGVDIDEALIQYDEGTQPGSDSHIYTSSFTLDVFWSRAA